ncbi:MAG: FkbM family methyltransferase [Pseudomonadota bacterium]
MAQPDFGTYTPSLWVRTLLALSQRTLLGRGKARRWLAGLLQDAHEGPLDAHIWNQPVRIHIGNNNNEMKALISPASFNRTERKALKDYLPRTGGVFVDIGANVGMLSIAARAHMETGTLVAIEPQPAMFNRLAFNLEQAGASSEVRCALVKAAIGASEGEADLTIPNQPGTASLATIDADAVDTVTVAVRPLLAVCEEIGIESIDVLKIDVEGFEDQALLPFYRAAPQTLWPGVVIMEHCHSGRWAGDVIAFLTERGYATVHRDRQNICLEYRAR